MSRKLLLLFAFFPIYQSWDLFQLHDAAGISFHLVVETIASVVFVVILYLFVRDRQRAADDVASLRRAAEASERAMVERGELAKSSTRNFLEVVQAQFAAWQFTPAEKDVGLLLIKGLSLEEIAVVRETKSKTVRQHATALYAKAALEGRHQLAAYFLEDLMTPAQGAIEAGR